MTAYTAGWMVVTDTVFENCRDYEMFVISDTEVAFSGCTFHNLEGDLVTLYGWGSASFSDCKFDNDLLRQLTSHPKYEDSIWIY